jgi:hypothetical protein
MVLLEINTGYLSQGIPVYGSRVLIWAENNNMPVLIYHASGDIGYILTDISDLGSSVIAALGRESEVHGMWYYLPQSIQEVIAEDVETVIELGKVGGNTLAEILQTAAQTIGKTAADLIKPLIDTLMIPLVIIGAIGMIYLIKKG